MRRHGLRTWVEVSRQALHGNLLAFQRAVGENVQIAPVIKANAYGHDSTWTAKTLQPTQIWGFCVAYGSEALDLHTTKPILVLSSWEDAELDHLIRRNVRLVAWDIEAARRIARTAERVGKRVRVHLKIDTGTTRIGTRADVAKKFLSDVQRMPGIVVDGIFSHFADSEGESLAFAREQQQRFHTIAREANVPWKHMACTAASLRLPPTDTNLIRLGIGLYGLWPSAATQRSTSIKLRPVLSWKTHVMQVKKIPAGTTVGYGRTFRAKRPMTIATLPVGYSDGFDRRASNASHVMLNGTRCPVIGRVSMNLTTIDTSRAPHVRAGDTVTLIGPGMPADDLAQSWGTLHYEVVSRIHPSIPRIATT